MSSTQMEVVEKLVNGRLIIKVEKEIVVQGKIKKIIKFTIADKNGIINLLDSKQELSGIQFFDCYYVNEYGDVIIGLKKDGEEYYNRVLSHFDLSETELQVIEAPSGPFNIGPYSKQYYNYIYPTKKIEDIIPQSYKYNYGLINRNGLLVIYPVYDQIVFGAEDTCRLGLLSGTRLKYGYNDLLSGIAITPICFDSALDFSEGRAVVEFNDKYGYIDRKKIMNSPGNANEYAKNLAPRFLFASSFDNGSATVYVNDGNIFGSLLAMKVGLNGEISEVINSSNYLRKREKPWLNNWTFFSLFYFWYIYKV